MCSVALEYRKAVDEMTLTRAGGLHHLELDEEEWKLVEELVNVLKILKDATLFLSTRAPALSSVLPIIEKINMFFDDITSEEAVPDTRFHPAICSSVQLAQRKLNKYYECMDWSDVYCISMVLHPTFKLLWFKSAGWPEDWVNAAREVTEFAYTSMYAHLPLETMGESNGAQDSGSKETSEDPFGYFLNFDYDMDDAAQEFPDELARYLSANTVRLPKDVSIISWWLSQREEYPRLSQMAIDYACIPASAVAVERVFSRGRFLLPYVRNRLSSRSTRALMCLGSWLKLGLVKNKDLIAATRTEARISEEFDI